MHFLHLHGFVRSQFFFKKKRCSACVNGAAPGVIMYFYSFYLMFMTKVDRIISVSGDLPEEPFVNAERYGTFLPPLVARYNNPLHLVIYKVREWYKNRYVLSFKLLSPVISVDYFRSESFHWKILLLMFCRHFFVDEVMLIYFACLLDSKLITEINKFKKTKSVLLNKRFTESILALRLRARLG